MRRPSPVRLSLYAIAIAFVAASTFLDHQAHGQEVGQGMVRSGQVGIQNETEHKLFWSLLCTCGCPRETLGTCTCGWAHQRRDELREMLSQGMTIEAIQQAYAERFGPQALAVPPNTGANRLLYIVPITLIVGCAAIVITSLRRWRRRSDAADKSASREGADPAERDELDEKLDDELKRMDDE